MKEANPKLLQEFLLRYRTRDKLKRKDYNHLTIQKAKDEDLIGKNYTGFTNIIPNTTIPKTKAIRKIKKQHILKYCNMLDIFTIREQFYSKTKEIRIQKDNGNWIKVYTQYSLSGVDLDNYLGILQLANLNSQNKTITDSEAKGDLSNTIRLILDLPELSKI